MDRQEFFSDLTAETRWSLDEAERFTSGVMATLAERATKAEREDLREWLHGEQVARPELDMSADEFFARVASRTGEPREDVDAVVRMVFRALRLHLGTGEAHRIESRLPDDLRRLWNPPPFGRR